MTGGHRRAADRATIANQGAEQPRHEESASSGFGGGHRESTVRRYDLQLGMLISHQGALRCTAEDDERIAFGGGDTGGTGVVGR